MLFVKLDYNDKNVKELKEKYKFKLKNKGFGKLADLAERNIKESAWEYLKFKKDKDPILPSVLTEKRFQKIQKR